MVSSFLAQPDVDAAYVIGDTLALENGWSFSPVFRICHIVLETYGEGSLRSIFAVLGGPNMKGMADFHQNCGG